MKKKLQIILLVLLCFNIKIIAQNEKLKAMMIFNFTKYICWEEKYQQGDFIITVFNNSEIVEHLDVISKKRKVGEQSIIIKQINNHNDLSSCHIIYIPSNKSNQLEKIAEKIINQNTLIISEKTGMIKKGSAINFYTQNGQLKFEMSKKNFDKSNLMVDPSLFLLGKLVD